MACWFLQFCVMMTVTTVNLSSMRSFVGYILIVCICNDQTQTPTVTHLSTLAGQTTKITVRLDNCAILNLH